MAVIEVNHVTKEYRLGQMRSIKQSMLNTYSRLRGNPVSEREPFKALDDVNFHIEQGEVVGIIGQNGAGKSTLLKMLAKISVPTTGDVKVQGKVAPLIEVGAGLIPDLTGRENIYLNGSILGMKRAELDEKFDDIVAFAELEEFIDTPIKRYSSGMKVRLGFSIATSIDAEVLIVDEVLAVGDLAFQRKCFDRMEDMIKRQGKTVLLVSHNIRQVERMCTRVILMDHGKVLKDGNPTEACNLFFDRSNQKIKVESQKSTKNGLQETEDLKFISVNTFDERGELSERIEFRRSMKVKVSFDVLRPLERICFLVGFHTTDFVYLTANNTVGETVSYDLGHHSVELDIKAMDLLPGVYSVRVWIGTPEGKVSFYGENLSSIQVYSDDHLIARQQEMGLFYLDGTWVLDSEAISDAFDEQKNVQKLA